MKAEIFRLFEPRFPTAIDSSMRASFVACPQQFAWRYIFRWQPLGVSVDLLAGKAFAAGMEEARRAFYLLGASPQQAIGLGAAKLIKVYGEYEPPEGHPKTCENLLCALDYALSEAWPLEEDTLVPMTTIFSVSKGLEFSFALALPGNMHPDTGEPLLYAGRFDMIGNVGGTLWVVDDKTTQRLGQPWRRQWDLRSQFTGYVKAAREFGYQVEGVIVRGVSILKYGNGHEQVMTYRPDWLVDAWWEQLVNHDVPIMKAYYEECRDKWERNDLGFLTQVWPRAYDSACSAYSGCPYKDLCLSREPQNWVKGNFVKATWNPISGTETIEEDEVDDVANAS